MARARARAGRRTQRRAGRARRRRVRPARVLRLRHRHTRRSTGSPPAACATRSFHTTALCSPTRACLMTGRNHHSVGMGRITDLARGYPGYSGPHPQVVPASCPRRCASTATRRSPSASGTSRPTTTPTSPRHATAGRSGAASSASTASSAARRTSSRPTLVHDNHFVEAPGSYDDGYHLTEDLADHAIEFITDLRAVDPEKPFFLYFCTGACHSPHHAPPEWVERYRGRFDQGWDVWREATYARQLDERHHPRGHRAAAATRLGPGVGLALRRRAARSRRASWSASPRTSRTPTRRSDASSSFLEELGELDNTLIVGRQRQRREQRGRCHTARSTTCGSGTSTRPGCARWSSRIDELGGPHDAQQLPVGLDDGRQHAAAPLEARGARGRRRRPLHRALPVADRGAR